MATGFSVFVNIGGKVLPSLAASVASAKRMVAGLEHVGRGMALGGIGGGLAAVAAAQARNTRRIAAAQSELFGAAATGWGLKSALAAPLRSATEFETALEDIGQKAELSGDKIASLGQRIRALAPALNQAPLKIAQGIDVLVGFGTKPDDAESMIGPIGKAATAYRAEIEDLAKAGFAVVDNLKLPAPQLGVGLDIMATSGKEGAFELKDMAREFASLTASAQALKMTGAPAVAQLSSALQIARKGAADGAEAANNTANLLQKIISPETTKKFKKLGVDIRKELKSTQASGGDIFEMIAAQTSKALGGDLSKIGDIFEDAQVQKALRPLIQNLDEYRRIRDKSRGARDVVDKDFESRMKTAAAVSQAFGVQLERLRITLGNALVPALSGVTAAVTPLVDALEKLTGDHPAATRAIAATAAGLIGLRVAASATKLGAAWLWGGALLAARGGLLAVAGGMAAARAAVLPFTAALRAARSVMLGFTAASAITGTGGALRVAGAAALAALNPLRLATAAAVGLGVALRGALLFTGIGAAIAAIAAGGLAIYNNWRGLLAFFKSFGAAFSKALGPKASGALSTVIGWISQAWGWVSKLTGEIDASGDRWRAWGTAAGTAVGEAVNYIAALPDKLAGMWDSFKSATESKLLEVVQSVRDFASQIVSAIESAAAGLYQAGVNMIAQLWEGMKAKVGELLSWVSGLGSRIKGAIGLGGGGEAGAVTAAPAVAGARALGGPVLAGRPYLVGECGPELFTPSSAGRIDTNQRLRRVIADGQTATAQASGVPVVPRGDISITNHWTINGADDPRAVAQFVDSRFRELIARLESEQRGLLSD
ncbi:phage tail tape measure protein [Rhodoplanes serenus]|uniref:Phage tail tape measure protein n=1 Tax=Rhodoplanes serenus TaxID=200615 RepID=A0A9X4XK45_9BRAD|nr:phage tail tape measure protein [Rhodoplanes serenus]MTW16632.1 phage tail tape measure protein [Rhodoplanes serenus]